MYVVVKSTKLNIFAKKIYYPLVFEIPHFGYVIMCCCCKLKVALMVF